MKKARILSIVLLLLAALMIAYPIRADALSVKKYRTKYKVMGTIKAGETKTLKSPKTTGKRVITTTYYLYKFSLPTTSNVKVYQDRVIAHNLRLLKRIKKNKYSFFQIRKGFSSKDRIAEFTLQKGTYFLMAHEDDNVRIKTSKYKKTSYPSMEKAKVLSRNKIERFTDYGERWYRINLENDASIKILAEDFNNDFKTMYHKRNSFEYEPVGWELYDSNGEKIKFNFVYPGDSHYYDEKYCISGFKTSILEKGTYYIKFRGYSEWNEDFKYAWHIKELVWY